MGKISEDYDSSKYSALISCNEKDFVRKMYIIYKCINVCGTNV